MVRAGSSRSLAETSGRCAGRPGEGQLPGGTTNPKSAAEVPVLSADAEWQSSGTTRQRHQQSCGTARRAAPAGAQQRHQRVRRRGAAGAAPAPAAGEEILGISSITARSSRPGQALGAQLRLVADIACMGPQGAYIQAIRRHASGQSTQALCWAGLRSESCDSSSSTRTFQSGHVGLNGSRSLISSSIMATPDSVS